MKMYCRNLLNICSVKMQTFQTFTSSYLTLLVCLLLCWWIKIPKPKTEDAGSFSENQRPKVHKLYTQVGAAYSFECDSVEICHLAVSTVENFLHSNRSLTNFTPATPKFGKMKAFAGSKDQIWYMDIAYVDKRATDNNVVKCLVVRQDVPDRTADVKSRETKNSRELLFSFLTMIT